MWLKRRILCSFLSQFPQDISVLMGKLKMWKIELTKRKSHCTHLSCGLWIWGTECLNLIHRLFRNATSLWGHLPRVIYCLSLNKAFAFLTRHLQRWRNVFSLGERQFFLSKRYWTSSLLPLNPTASVVQCFRSVDTLLEWTVQRKQWVPSVTVQLDIDFGDVLLSTSFTLPIQ